MTSLATRPCPVRPTRIDAGRARPSGVRRLMAAEALAGLFGFAATVHLARGLGPAAFARFEFAAAATGWLLVVVRGGIDVVVYREAARRPRLVGRFTDLLIGLRLAFAAAGCVAIGLLAPLLGPARGAVLAVSGLALLPAAWAADVAPRASGRFAWVALVQAARVVAYASLVHSLITGSGHATRAAWCAVAAEAIAAGMFSARHAAAWGWPRPRYRRRAWSVLARRGLVAGLGRLGRVGLYAADVLLLGLLAAPDLGPYVAARRVAFGVAALGLVVPATVGPVLARAWASGAGPAGRALETAARGLVAIALPAAAGLMLVADRLMPALVGSTYRDAGPALVANAARLAPLLVGNLHHAALVAFRRESASLALIAAQVALAGVALPIAAILGGAVATGWAMAGVEVVGAATAWRALRPSTIAPAWHHGALAPIAAVAALAAACVATRRGPLALTVLVGAAAYGLVLALLGPRVRSRCRTRSRLSRECPCR